MEPGTTLAQYRIIEKLGQGGMGEVYRATDTKLDREVAIKILPQEICDDPGRRKRFLKEAKAASASPRMSSSGVKSSRRRMGSPINE